MNAITFTLLMVAAFASGAFMQSMLAREAQAEPCTDIHIQNCRLKEFTDTAGGKFMQYVCDPS